MSSPAQLEAGTAAAPDAGDVEMSPQDLLLLAVSLHRENRWEAAEKCYRSLLVLEADNANAQHFLGVLLHQRGQGEPALALIQASLARDPGVAPWHNNLGNVLLDSGRFEEAARAYLHCAELDPDNLEVLNNLGVLYRKMQMPAQAEDVFKRALARAPDFADVHNNLATLYVGLNRMPEAFSHFADALALRPNDKQARRLLAIAYGKAGRMEEGRQACLEWLQLEPDSPQARHFYAAYGGVEVPERASDQYVVDEFDGFANSFDAKLSSLGYQAPQLVGDAVARLLGAPAASLELLDAGCGTGLCGPLLRPFARRLAGVDLSANMLAHARQRGLYDELAHAELVAYLQDCHQAFDLVVSADTLCYFGRLDAVFAAVRQALRADGHWVFTVEAHALDAPFKLHTHGRYSHGRDYVVDALARAGFARHDIRQVTLRFESGEPVAGWLVAAW
jgi:predicted TPR repeat methyltransferase